MDVEATGKKLSKTDMESSDLHIARKLYGPDVHYLSVKLITKVLSKGEKFYGLSGQGWMDGDDFNIREYKFKGFVSPDNEYSDASGAKADYEEGDSVCIKDRRDTFNAYDCEGNGSKFGTGSGCDPILVFARKESKSAKKSRKSAEATFKSFMREGDESREEGGKEAEEISQAFFKGPEDVGAVSEAEVASFHDPRGWQARGSVCDTSTR